mgnify:CR=1 FL=1
MSNEPFNAFKEAFRNYVLAGASVTSLISQRFYGAQLATLFNETYPLAVFWANEGKEETYLQDFILNVRGCSDSTYDEAHNIYNVIRDRLNNIVISNRIKVRPINTPTELYETDPRIYSVIGRFRIQRILTK